MGIATGFTKAMQALGFRGVVGGPEAPRFNTPAQKLAFDEYMRVQDRADKYGFDANVSDGAGGQNTFNDRSVAAGGSGPRDNIGFHDAAVDSGYDDRGDMGGEDRGASRDGPDDGGGAHSGNADGTDGSGWE